MVYPRAIQLPRLGRVRLKQCGYLPATGTSATTDVKVLSATISEQAGHWHVSVLVEQEQQVPKDTGPVVGLDLGVKVFATLRHASPRFATLRHASPRFATLRHAFRWDGHSQSQAAHKRRLKTLKRLQRAVARKQKGSNNRRKAARNRGKQHRKVGNQRQHTLHQVTTRLAETKSVVVIEDLQVAGLLKNHHLAQAIGDGGFGEFRRQLTYKAAWYGCRVVVASRWEPSSKTCSGCGWVDAGLMLADRTFHWQVCGLVLDRDWNAAINVAKLADSSPESRNACGGESAGRGHEAAAKLSSVKQEPNTV